MIHLFHLSHFAWNILILHPKFFFTGYSHYSVHLPPYGSPCNSGQIQIHLHAKSNFKNIHQFLLIIFLITKTYNFNGWEQLTATIFLIMRLAEEIIWSVIQFPAKRNTKISQFHYWALWGPFLTKMCILGISPRNQTPSFLTTTNPWVNAK